METVFATLAFTALVVGQFAAVIAVSKFNGEQIESKPRKIGAPKMSWTGFAARFAKHFDEETAKLYSDVSRRSGGRPPRGFLNPLFVAFARALRPAAEQPTATVVPMSPKATPARRGDTEKLPLAA